MKLQGDLVVERGRVLGRLERWDNPQVVLGRRCPHCEQLVPVTNWQVHLSACHSVGWGAYKCSMGGFAGNHFTTSRRTKQDTKIRKLAELLGL